VRTKSTSRKLGDDATSGTERCRSTRSQLGGPTLRVEVKPESYLSSSMFRHRLKLAIRGLILVDKLMGRALAVRWVERKRSAVPAPDTGHGASAPSGTAPALYLLGLSRLQRGCH
jgi:hypothetical protein